MHNDDEIIAIGTIAWNNQLQEENPDQQVLRTLQPICGRRFTVDQLRIEPGLAALAAPGELSQIRSWVSEQVQLRFGPSDFETARELLSRHGLLGS